MHATIDMQFELSIDDDKTVPLAVFGEEFTEQNIEATIPEQLIASLDEQLVEALCGEKHARGNGDERFQRRGTKSRSAVTTAGEHNFALHYVEDTAAGPEEDAYFRPTDMRSRLVADRSGTWSGELRDAAKFECSSVTRCPFLCQHAVIEG